MSLPHTTSYSRCFQLGLCLNQSRLSSLSDASYLLPLLPTVQPRPSSPSPTSTLCTLPPPEFSSMAVPLSLRPVGGSCQRESHGQWHPAGVRDPPPTLPGSAHHLSRCPLPSLRLPTPFPAAHSFPALEMQSLRRASRAVGCSRSARSAR